MTRTRLTLLLVGMILCLAACGETWRGVKQDTRENVNAVGKGVEKAGEKIQQQVQ